MEPWPLVRLVEVGAPVEGNAGLAVEGRAGAMEEKVTSGGFPPGSHGYSFRMAGLLPRLAGLERLSPCACRVS
jgi:hypothetical protein